MEMIILALLIIFMAIFAIWGQFYIQEKNRQTLLDNIERYEKEKIKQQKSKVSTSVRKG